MESIITPSEELKIFRGADFRINEFFSIHIPTLNEICDMGESEYYSTIYQITSTPTDMCWQLWDNGIDYTKISDWELFYNIIVKALPFERTKIIFEDIEFDKFTYETHPQNGSIILLHPSKKWYIDEFTYETIVQIIREIHFFKKNIAIPANESTKMILIEDAREDYLIRKNKPSQSYLLNLISAMTNIEGFKYNHNTVWDVKINAFMDSVMRIGKIKNANLLLQSGYSGFGINLKEINKKQIDWMGSLRD